MAELGGSAVRVTALVMALMLVACSPAATSPSPTATSPGARVPSPAPGATQSPGTAPDAAVVTREVPFDGSVVTVAVHPVEVDGGLALLTVDYTAADGDELPPLGLVLNGAERFGGTGAIGLRLVDPTALLVYPVLQSGDGDFLASRPNALAPVDGTATSQSVHVAPDGQSVDVFIPLLGAVTDVPVVPAGGAFEQAVDELGNPPADAAGLELRSYTAALDDGASVAVEGEQITVRLESDVLFAPSEFVLSATATNAVAAAAAQIRTAAEGGEVRVVGHTDDVDTPESNQVLSEQRATTVADALRATLGDGYSIAAEGRGESEPVVPGTSEEARAANRRVEITFDGVRPTERAEATPQVPAATGKTAAADETVEFQRDADTYSLTVESVERRGGTLLGTLRLGLVAGDGSMIGALGDPDIWVTAERGFVITAAYTAPLGVALLDGAGFTFPFDYEIPTAEDDGVRRRLLADEQVNQGASEPGSTVTVQISWPDTGADTVTIDVPGRVRFVDVPVSG